jgi:poly(3-hydroxybutyrate) depolymerase
MFEMGHAAVKPARLATDVYRQFLSNPLNPLSQTPLARSATAACEVFERTTRRYGKPSFGITRCHSRGRETAVEENVIRQSPFCRIVHFRRDLPADRIADPRILLVAPMSGHHATLLRGTVKALLPEHDVYVTDWSDARTVPVGFGRFDLDSYVDHMIEVIRLFQGDVHIMAVCQPAVPVLAAVSRLEALGDPNVPASMILLGGPIDTRVSPTAVNRLAERRSIGWFERNVITTVPWPHRGRGRDVYPGFLQLTGFMTMNLDRHIIAHKDLFLHLVRNDGDSAEKHREFYDEYLAVMDLPAEFYLQTIESVFMRHDLAVGSMRHHGDRVDPGSIQRVALMTVEGEQDDITGKGQCASAHKLCAAIPETMKLHFEQPGVGHYGIFNGSRFRKETLPRIAGFVRLHDRPFGARQDRPQAYPSMRGSPSALSGLPIWPNGMVSSQSAQK